MLEIVKILASEIQVGMYVSRLDRPWLETPFVLQGFRIENEDDIGRLQDHCAHVFIDTVKSVEAPEEVKRKVRNRKRLTTQQLFGKREITDYKDSATWPEEYPKAQEAVHELSFGIDEIFDNVATGGALNVITIKKSVEPMIDSVVRNPDACIWLARLKQEDQYTYQHSLGASIWAVALGRQLGLPKSDLRSLAIGGLLFDIGKLAIDKELLLSNKQLTKDEFQQVRDHVRFGVEMIENSHLMNTDVIDMVSHHHERHNGSGYPHALKGNAIPVFARIAAIVDCYDAITSHRSYARAIPPTQAIKCLYDWKDIDFQAELVEAFIQAIGIYPAGSLVELSSGEIAVVVSEYRTRRLRPQVMVLLDSEKQPVSGVKMLDLLAEEFTADGEKLDIVNSLEPEAYGIDMTAMQL